MKRLLLSALSLVMLASLVATGSAKTMTHSMTHSKMMMKHHCPAGMHYVHGYMKGKKHVKGYCRK
ncbi:MAG: hypothetical protein M3Y21_05315 [Candidatus Eremiobacteraeota bacterium]|nr:hypothetical protein [Candidatus Eremiobacteraeota bacterium]